MTRFNPDDIFEEDVYANVFIENFDRLCMMCSYEKIWYMALAFDGMFSNLIYLSRTMDTDKRLAFVQEFLYLFGRRVLAL